jgi:hypothetical protein
MEERRGGRRERKRKSEWERGGRSERKNGVETEREREESQTSFTASLMISLLVRGERGMRKGTKNEGGGRRGGKKKEKAGKGMSRTRGVMKWK